MKLLEEGKTMEKNGGGGDSDSELLNLEKELYSLTHYADDVEELVSQMFSSIKGTKLQAMLPPILKEIPLIDVQQLCLHELRGMSSRRILSIINGVEMSDSSSEEDDLLDRKLKSDAESKIGKDGFSEAMDAEAVANIALPDDPNLTELDVLELEMRAKLIKTMLNKQPGEESGDDKDLDEASEFDPAIKIKQEPHSSDEDSARKGRRRSRKRRGSSSSSSGSSSSRSYSSRSYSSSGSHSSSGGSEKFSDDSDYRKNSKKKITKKEFEARMRKARMNRSYRKRKESDDDSANESRRRQRRRRKHEKIKETSEAVLPDSVENVVPVLKENDVDEKEEEAKDDVIITDQKEAEMEIDLTEKEKEDPPEEEVVLEKEEGELDSNEEKSYSDTSSSYSSRSYSSSPKRHRRSKKRRSRRRRSITRSPSVPKVPNWEAGSKSALPKKTAKPIEEIKTLPLTEDRQSVSFSLSKKTGPIVTADPNLQDEPVIKKLEKVTIASKKSLPIVTAEPNIQDEPVIEKLEKVTIASTENSEAATEDEQLQELLAAKSKLEALVSQATEDVDEEEECISISDEEEDGAVSENSDGEMEVEEPSAPLEEESQDVSEALEEGTTSEVTAEETSQDLIDEGLEEQPEQSAAAEETTEIIGVIDPMDDNASSAFNDCVSGSSWSTRWLQSEKVQQVVSDSKMLSKMRKNIQAKGKGRVKKTLLKSVAPPPIPPVLPPVIPVLESKVPAAKLETKPKKLTGGIGGNADDYENVFGIKLKVPVSLPAPKPVKPVTEPAAVPVKAKSLAATLLDSDDDDDSEDDELWSKIMKK